MFCRDCGTQLSLRFLENEGLIPYCEKCGAFKFPYFPVAVSMTVVNRAENKILLAKHTGEDTYKLFAGYIKQGESAEKAIPRELKEETKLNAVKWRYFGSRYHEAKNVLMLNFIVTADEGRKPPSGRTPRRSISSSARSTNSAEKNKQKVTHQLSWWFFIFGHSP